MICSSCQQKLIETDVNKKTIWGFNPYSYHSFHDLKNAFRNFYKNNQDRNYEFYSCYNNDGYTYTQWYVYIISKNNYRYKPLKKQTLWIFQILSRYDFFKKLISLGKRDDHLHNTLHHFLKHLDNMGIYQQRILNLLLENELKLDTEDSDGMTGNDYIISKTLSEEDLKTSKEITRQYKLEEEDAFSHQIFTEQSFIKCEICNDFVDKYQDMVKNKSKIIEIDSLVQKFINIIDKRQQCIEIYKKYENCQNSTDRHLHVVNIYRDIFLN
jgi:hypothetical protein